MTKYREILRLTALGFSQRDIIHDRHRSEQEVVSPRSCADRKTYARLRVCPQRVATQWCDQETTVDRVS